LNSKQAKPLIGTLRGLVLSIGRTDALHEQAQQAIMPEAVR
jgi:hypothetical protein